MTLKRVLYQYENIAKYPPDWAKKRTLYQYENIAKYGPDWPKKRALYSYENITYEPPFPYIDTISTRRAPAGSVITVTGNGFGAKYQSDAENVDRSLRGYGGYIYIGSQICNIISWSWTEITFQLPVEAVTGAIKVRLTAPTTRDSNLIGFEVYETAPANDIGLELFICDRNNPNTILCQLDGAKDKAFQALLNGAGSGQFSISRYDVKGSNRDYIKDQNFVLCRLDGIDVFKWIIEGRNPNYVDSSEQPAIKISGRGVLAMLGWGEIYPEDMGAPVLDRNFTGSGGAILRTLVLEAQARGCFPGIVVDWTADADSIGNPFIDTTTITFHVGTPLTEVVTKFTEGMGLFDIEMTPELKLKIYKIKGENKYDTVKYRPAQGILSHQNQSDATKVVNDVLVEGDNGTLAIADHATSKAEWGRREGYLQARNITNGLSEYGQMYLNKSAFAEWGIQGKVTKFIDSQGNKIKPFETFLNGDWIGWYIPPEGNDTAGFDGNLRVKGITCQEDAETGDLSYTLELNNVMLENEIKMAQSVERMSMYSGNSALSNGSTQAPVPADHNHTHGLLKGLGEDDHPQYLNNERHAADPHSGISRVSSLKKYGGNALTGDVSLVPGTNVTLTQNDEAKTITIATSGGSGGTSYYRKIDEPPAIPNSMDDEFDGDTLDNKWIVWNQSAQQTIELIDGFLVMETPTSGEKRRVFAVMQPISDVSWKFRIKVAIEGLVWNFMAVTMIARNTSIDRSLMAGIMSHSSYGCMTGYAMRLSGVDYGGAEYDLCNWVDHEFYLEMECDGTNLYFRISKTGTKFRLLFQQALSDYVGNPNQIGINIHAYDDTGSYWSGLVSFDWFRRIS